MANNDLASVLSSYLICFGTVIVLWRLLKKFRRRGKADAQHGPTFKVKIDDNK